MSTERWSLGKSGACALASLAAAGIGAGCGTNAISADTSCRDYLQRPGDERHDAAVRISADIGGVSNPGNPMWGLSLDGACGSNPSMTIGEYFGRGQTGQGATSSTTPSDDSEAGRPAVPAEGFLTNETKAALEAAAGESIAFVLSAKVGDGGVLRLEIPAHNVIDFESGDPVDVASELEKVCDAIVNATGARGVLVFPSDPPSKRIC